ncbi:diguanylate cyclase domain-containing protein [uncultured Ruminococcus sp.]|uniref:diguanylate cyclase domain-containing protein n=1 Tax=uncultured Ruminococcus sp. TaxID=165186 RepID=UPI0025F3D25B|nr:diguanylate cyclase [uncultured Ruminococcus sp.]
MDYQLFVDGIDAAASVYSFDVLPDGSFGEIRLMAVNKGFFGFFSLNPNAPEFVPGMPYRKFFHDPNFESFCYKCASKREPLYSYVNAHGAWLSGQYLPLYSEEEDTLYCCYILKISKQMESEELAKRSSEIAREVLEMSIKLHKNQDFISAVAETAGDIRRICCSERCSVVLVDRTNKECTFVNENGANESYLNGLAASMRCSPYDMAMRWEADLRGSDCLLLDDLSVLKDRDPEWYNSLDEKEIRSIVLYAVRFNNELMGFIWAANFDVEKIMSIKETLELSTFFLGAIIANHQLLGRLETLGMYDVLTGVMNRNAMNKRVDQLNADKGALPAVMGVVFADLNGLKTVNDSGGHDEGDKLLKRAAGLLKRAFDEYEIFRAGGDEFVIICQDITEDELASRTAELRRLAADTDNVSFAVGTGFFTGDYDVINAMQIADERMYIDKQEYYRLNPEKKRRHGSG